MDADPQHPSKFGTADLDRVTQSSGRPTRIHQQVRQ
jgi:hypothetical protein